MDVSVTAPGKVILLGEYAVLQGEPALAMAVNRGARVEVNASCDGACSVCAPGMGLPPARFSFRSDGNIRWLDEECRFYGLPQSVLTILSENQVLRFQSQPGFDIHLDSTAMYARDSNGRLIKLGLGSSAALVTALAWALLHCADGPEWPDERWITLLIEAHRLFQQGQGSGVDVATSFCGGVIEYKRLDGRPIMQRLSLPSTLKLVFVWSGRAVSTPGLLRRLRAWQMKYDADSAVIMRAMGEAVTQARAAAERDSGEDFVVSAGRFAEILADLGECAGLEIFSSAHLELAAMAKKSGLVYKPCGAGGGDLGVAMGTDVNNITQFVNLIKSSRYQVVDLTTSAAGVRTIRSQ